jgi:hypothetical protein
MPKKQNWTFRPNDFALEKKDNLTHNRVYFPKGQK